MISPEVGREYLAVGHELSGVEFKAAGSRDDRHFFAKVMRAMLGMANRRDGGYIFIGVNDQKVTTPPPSLDATELERWVDYEVLVERVSKFADPLVTFDCAVLDIDGASIVVLEIAEFDSLPVLCKVDHTTPEGRQVLRKGACYVRSAHKPETSEVPSQLEMRELLDLAAEKRLRAHLMMTQKAGGVIVQQDELRTAEQSYLGQLGDLA